MIPTRIPTRNAARARAALGAALAVSAVTLLSACSAGQVGTNASTASGVNGAVVHVGELSVLDATIAYPPGPSITNPKGGGGSYKVGESADLSFTIANAGVQTDKLVSISSPAASTVKLKGALTIPGGTTIVAGSAAQEANPQSSVTATLEQLTAPISAGLNVQATFTFERAGAVTVSLPVASPAEARTSSSHS